MLCVEQDTKQKQSQTPEYSGFETKSAQVRRGFEAKQEAQTWCMLLY